MDPTGDKRKPLTFSVIPFALAVESMFPLCFLGSESSQIGLASGLLICFSNQLFEQRKQQQNQSNRCWPKFLARSLIGSAIMLIALLVDTFTRNLSLNFAEAFYWKNTVKILIVYTAVVCALRAFALCLDHQSDSAKNPLD